MCSTKRPIGSAAEANVSAKSKCKLREKQEDMILQKAINVMDKSVKKDDEDDIFGKYVATELRAIENPHVKRYTKWQIQSLIFSAHSGFPAQSGPSWQHPSGQPSCPFPKDQMQPMTYQQVPANTVAAQLHYF